MPGLEIFAAELAKVVEKFEAYPKSLPAMSQQLLMESELRNLWSEEAVAYLRREGTRLGLSAEEVGAIRTAYQSARDSILPVRTELGAAWSAAQTWTDRSGMAGVLQDCLNLGGHPLGGPVERLVTSVSEKGLAAALAPEATAQALHEFSRTARKVEAATKLTQEQAKEICDRARGLFRPEIISELETRFTDTLSQGQFLEFLQQRAKALAGSSLADAQNALANLRTQANNVQPAQWVQVIEKTQDAVVGGLTDAVSQKLAEHQRQIGDAAVGIQVQVKQVSDAAIEAFQSARDDFESAKSTLDEKYGKAVKTLAQAREAADFVKAFAERRLGTGDLVGMLDLPVVSNLEPLQKLKEPLRKMQQLQKLASVDVREVLSGGADAWDMAANVATQCLGIPKETADTGKAIASIALSMATGNYIGAAASLLGASGMMGGGGGPDPVIAAQLGAISGKLDQVLANQQKMMAKLEDIERKLDQLLDELRDFRRETMEKLADIDKRMEAVHRLTYEMATADISSCQVFVGQMVGPRYEPGILKSRQYSDWVDFFEDRVSEFKTCSKALEVLVNGDKPAAHLLYGIGPENSYNKARAYLRSIEDLCQRYRQQLPDTGPEKKKRLIRLLMPALLSKELDQKYSADPPALPKALGDWGETVEATLSGARWLVPQAVLQCSERALIMSVVAPFVRVEAGIPRLLSLEELGKPANVKQAWQQAQNDVDRWLWRAFTVLQISIAQQTLLTGDWLLWDARFSATVPAEIRKEPMMTRNCIRTMVYSRLKVGGKSTVQYSAAGSLGREILEGLLNIKDQAKLTLAVVNQNEWYLGEVVPDLKLPTVSELRTERLEVSEDLTQLVRMRERVANAMADIGAGVRLSSGKEHQTALKASAISRMLQMSAAS